MAKQKIKRNYTKEVERGDITVEAASKELKEEIISEVRAVAGGWKQSIFELVEKGKELLALEEMLAEKTDTKPASKSEAKRIGALKKASAGIKPLAGSEEIDEDDF